MFTGIIEEVGTVRSIERQADHARLHIDAPGVVADAEVGDSIAVDGCCLTITSLPGASFTADLMAETLRATALADLAHGDGVNLEAAMRAGDRFGGHLVQGHVDGVGEVVRRDEQPGTVFLDIEAPQDLTRYLVPKGSVTVAGVSLTIVQIDDAGVLRVGLIPHTLGATTFHSTPAGRRLNLEVDVVAKYVERLLGAGMASPYVADGPIPASGAAGSGWPSAPPGTVSAPPGAASAPGTANASQGVASAPPGSSFTSSLPLRSTSIREESW